jgi:acetyl-CoA synthetase
MVGAEHPLFVLYTSGSTGKPKGVQHSTGGYLLWANLTMNWTFDLKDNDIFWCTADIGWITGHSYVAYGPLAAGATQIVFEGVPTYPNAGRFWQMIEKHKCTIFYTAPTAIRSLIKAAEGDEKVHPARSDLSAACASWARWASRSTRKPGCGTTRTSAASAARSSTPSGRPRPAAT